MKTNSYNHEPYSPEKRRSLPVAVAKVYGKRVIDTVRNVREGLPSGYVRDVDTARVMAHWEDEDRTDAARTRAKAHKEHTADNMIGFELDMHDLPEPVKQHVLAIDASSREGSDKFSKKLTNHMDRQASKMGNTMRRRYEISKARGTHSDEFFINQARVAKVNPIPRPHDR